MKYLSGIVVCGLLVMLVGCGGGVQTLVLGKSITLGPADVTVTKLTEVESIEGEEIMSEEVATEKLKKGAFLIVEWSAKNSTDSNAIVPEPQVRTADGKYIDSQMLKLAMTYSTSVEGAGSLVGADLQPKENREGMLAVYDVPTGALELAFKDGYTAKDLGEAMVKGDTKTTFYKLPTPAKDSKAVLGEDGFAYQ